MHDRTLGRRTSSWSSARRRLTLPALALDFARRDLAGAAAFTKRLEASDGAPAQGGPSLKNESF